jgi:hypothetical protein
VTVAARVLHSSSSCNVAAMKKLAIGLWIAQVLAAGTMLIAAGVKTESILATGPALTVIGLLLGLTTRALQSRSALAFALSGPLVCAFISFLIAAFHWSPLEGHIPTLVVLSTYVIVIVPLAFMSWCQIWRWETAPNARPTTAFQFRLKTLLLVMTATCILIPTTKFLANNLRPADTLIFGSFTLLVLVLTGLVVWRYLIYPSVAR